MSNLSQQAQDVLLATAKQKLEEAGLVVHEQYAYLSPDAGQSEGVSFGVKMQGYNRRAGGPDTRYPALFVDGRARMAHDARKPFRCKKATGEPDWSAFVAFVKARAEAYNAQATERRAKANSIAANADQMQKHEVSCGVKHPNWAMPQAHGVTITYFPAITTDQYRSLLLWALQEGLVESTVNEAALPSIDEMRGILRKEGTNAS